MKYRSLSPSLLLTQAFAVALAALFLVGWRAPLFAAAAISILRELSFTLYSAVTDIFSLLGHVYKLGATLRAESAPGRGVRVIVKVPRRAA